MAKPENLILAGNWKLNPTTLAEANKLSGAVIKQASPVRGIDFIICPPHLYVASIKKSYRGKKIQFGVQDMYPAESGGHTGQISPTQLFDLGVSHVVLGHSERRASMENGGAGETDELINIKIKAAIRHGLTPIVCIGESKRDRTGSHLRFITNQIKATFAGVSGKQMKNIIIAYEPVWAIGGRANKAISGHDLHEMALYIQKVASSIWGSAVANKLTVLYGGSVKPENAYELTLNGRMNGFFVGGASLSADSFIGIAKEMVRATKTK